MSKTKEDRTGSRSFQPTTKSNPFCINLNIQLYFPVTLFQVAVILLGRKLLTCSLNLGLKLKPPHNILDPYDDVLEFCG